MMNEVRTLWVTDEHNMESLNLYNGNLAILKKKKDCHNFYDCKFAHIHIVSSYKPTMPHFSTYVLGRNKILLKDGEKLHDYLHVSVKLYGHFVR